MKRYLYLILLLPLFTGCGNVKNTAETTTSDPENSTAEETMDDVVDLDIIENVQVKVFSYSDKFFEGIMRDKRFEEGCDFTIETDLGDGNGTVLLNPVHLVEEFKKDGLEVRFAFIQSMRPSDCLIATPIILDSIAILN